MQKSKLLYPPQQENYQRTAGNEEVLQTLQKAYDAQRDEVSKTTSFLYRGA